MTTTAAEAAFYRALNSVVEPVVRAGIGSPCGVSPAGLIVLQTRGLRSGLPRSVPLFAMLIGGYTVAATMRVQRSRWLQNVRHCPDVRYWLGGQVRDARAFVVMPGEDPPDVDEPRARQLAEALRIPAAMAGAAFVILAPAASNGPGS